MLKQGREGAQEHLTSKARKGLRDHPPDFILLGEGQTIQGQSAALEEGSRTQNADDLHYLCVGTEA
jgi:hypothetical protein